MRLSLFKILLFSVIRFQVHMSWKNWREMSFRIDVAVKFKVCLCTIASYKFGQTLALAPIPNSYMILRSRFRT